MTERKAISQRIRFEVFKRDKFTCQYCGSKAPDVLLQVDHVEPVAEGGSNDILNLVTACGECNGGKGALRLSDDSILEKSRKQAEILQERREQIEMIAEWHRELANVESLAVSKVSDLIASSKYVPNAVGMGHIARWIKKFGLAETMAATDTAFTQYFRGTKESWEHAFSMIPRVAKCKEIERENPVLAKAMLYRGILRKRLNYVNYDEVLEWLQVMLVELGEGETSRICNSVSSWTKFTNLAHDAIQKQRAKQA